MHRIVTFIAVLALAGCDLPPPPPQTATPAGSSQPISAMTPQQAAQTFTQVSRAVGPQAVQECRRRTTGANCNFRIQVDADPRAPANAFQTVSEDGQPVITFTASMIATARNADELAFVMGHEAAHHIAGHLDRQALNAAAGAVIFEGLASLTGGNASDIREAKDLGAFVGARSYSKEFELEADELGTIITHRAGYNPLIGAQFFSRIPDPGNRFLGSHPPNAERIEVVRRTSRQLGLIP